MEGPDISVVIAAVNGPELLGLTLDSLERLPERERLEVVVVATEALDPVFQQSLEQRQGKVVYDGRLSESIPRLRHRGIQASTAPIVAIIEDHVAVESGWARTILQKMDDRSVSAVGGRVESGRGGWLNTGVFLADYARYIGPVAEGPYADLPGNNVAYRREALLEYADALADGKWESWVNEALAAAGHRMISTNDMVVSHIKGFHRPGCCRLRRRSGGYRLRRRHCCCGDGPYGRDRRGGQQCRHHRWRRTDHAQRRRFRPRLCDQHPRNLGPGQGCTSASRRKPGRAGCYCIDVCKPADTGPGLLLLQQSGFGDACSPTGA